MKRHYVPLSGLLITHTLLIGDHGDGDIFISNAKRCECEVRTWRTCERVTVCVNVNVWVWTAQLSSTWDLSLCTLTIRSFGYGCNHHLLPRTEDLLLASIRFPISITLRAKLRMSNKISAYTCIKNLLDSCGMLRVHAWCGDVPVWPQVL